MRRMVASCGTAAILLVLLAGCGGSEATPSTVPSEEPSAPPASIVPASIEPTEAPTEAPATAATVRKTAQCAGVAVRKGPSVDDEALVRLAKGAKVRVKDTVTGDAYEAGACGESGDTWLEIDRINGKSIKTLYGVTYGYVAAGFFD